MTDAAPRTDQRLIDVAGIRVGHATRRGDGWLTGTTVVLARTGGAVGGVDVRGGGPGTRETDLLDPRNLVERVHAVVLTGGSAFGLAAADGVMHGLAADGVGLPVGRAGRGRADRARLRCSSTSAVAASFACRPDAAFGGEAYRAALSAAGAEGGAPGRRRRRHRRQCRPAQGRHRLGQRGARGRHHGRRHWSWSTPSGPPSTRAPASCMPPGSRWAPSSLRWQHRRRPTCAAARRRRPRCLARRRPRSRRWPRRSASSPPTRTLTKAQCAKVAGIGHDGLARAIRPVHTMFDGDTLFALATGARPAPGPVEMHALLGAAADCVTRAIGHAVLAAETVRTPVREWRSYRDAFPSAFPAVPTVSDEGGPA